MSKATSLQELTAFISRLATSLSTDPSSETIASLHSALEELRIAEETLHEQSAELQGALQRAEEERRSYLELFEFAPDAYCVTDRSGVILEVNQAACELLHADAAALIGKPLFVFIASDEKSRLRSFVSQVVDEQPVKPSRNPYVWQTEFLANRHSTVYISARCCLSRNSLKWPRLLWMWRDVTEQKETATQLERVKNQLERTVGDKTIALQQRLEELENFHDVVVGRELRLIELEKKIKQLESKNNSPSIT